MRQFIPALLLAGLTVPALAQPAPTHLRGTIEAVAPHSITVETREGTTVTVALSDPLTVGAMKRLDLSAITNGSFIGTAARPGPDGKLIAQEVFVFPESGRGTGEGHRLWDLTPDSTMTNATVSGVVADHAGHDLTLTYKGGSQTVVVPPGVPIVGPAPASRADLKPGAQVFFTPVHGADGGLSVARIIVSKDGVAPPL